MELQALKKALNCRVPSSPIRLFHRIHCFLSVFQILSPGTHINTQPASQPAQPSPAFWVPTAKEKNNPTFCRPRKIQGPILTKSTRASLIFSQVLVALDPTRQNKLPESWNESVYRVYRSPDEASVLETPLDLGIPLVVWGSTPPPLDEEFLIDAIVSASRNEAFKVTGLAAARSSCSVVTYMHYPQVMWYTSTNVYLCVYILHHKQMDPTFTIHTYMWHRGPGVVNGAGAGAGVGTGPII
ncbi:hypothetical protein K445DRAFT_15814 [Daldinia sp. EC12]|nr:hypothetical protein K445DRAFT_15814 [Daldinia sp. EC12]